MGEPEHTAQARRADVSATDATVAVGGESLASSASPTPVSALSIGASAGRYVVLRELGAGGMGAVYEAYDPELNRNVALKLLLPDTSHRGTLGDGRRRLLREAQAMARLSHPNVVTVHDVGEHEGQVYVAMELCVGETLRAWIDRGPHPWRATLEIMRQAGRGLAAAHDKGLVHRDFKPLSRGPSPEHPQPVVRSLATEFWRSEGGWSP